MPVPLTSATSVEMRGRMIYFRHRPTCPGAELVEEPSSRHEGAVRVTCLGCREFLNIYPRKEQQPRVLRKAPPSRWRCAEHPDEPVTWRGRGCASCAAGEVAS